MMRYEWLIKWMQEIRLCLGKSRRRCRRRRPPSPTCDVSMKHAQLEYSRNKHCDFLPSFAKESGVVSKANKKGRIKFGKKKVPADLAVQAFAKSNTIEGECRIISLVGTTPEGRAFAGRVHNEMLSSNRKENCDVRLYETDKQMLIDNRQAKKATITWAF